MRKAIYLYIIAGATLTFITGCTGGGRRAADHVPQARDTLYTEQQAMDVYGHDPERALTIIDSAEIVGNIADFRADMLRAKVYGRSMETMRLDTAQTICEALLHHDSIKHNADLQVEVIDQLINICRLRQDNETWLHWATEKAGLCHEQARTKPTEAGRLKAETEALRTEVEISLIQAHLGLSGEGLARLDYIIARLDRPGSVNRFDALMIALKRKINLLHGQGRYTDVIPVANLMLDRLNHFALHPANYAEDSNRLPSDSADRTSYIDFCRAQAHAFLANAYTAHTAPRLSASDRAQASHHLALFEQTDFSKTFAGRRQIAPAWIALGEYDKALASFDEQEQQMQGDTLRDDYAFILRSRARITEARGQLATSLDYRRRYESLNDTLHTRLQESKAHDYAVRYQLQEQCIETEHLKARTARNQLINIGIGIVLLLALAVLAWYRRQQRTISRKNRSLVEQISEAIKYKKMYEEIKARQPPPTLTQPLPGDIHPTPSPEMKGSAPLKGGDAVTTSSATPSSSQGGAKGEPLQSEVSESSSAELFDRIHNIIKRDKLYLDPSFDRQAIIDHLHLPKERIGQAFTQGSDYSSLSDFIRDCRLEHACELLGTTDMPIGDIATASGFSRVTTFNHDFKMKYNVAPSIYRRQLRQ